MGSNITLEQLLYTARHYNASDIHLIVGLPPAWRVNGDIIMAESSPCTAEELSRLALDSLTPVQREMFGKDMALCYSFNHEELGRFRVSIYLRNGKPELAIRACANQLRTREELGLPEKFDTLTERPSGLILVTGPTGSGKSTTLNYMIDQINSRRRCKISTLEDPIEFVHDHKMALVVQQELYSDVPSFSAGLLHILRLDPDVIAIGEMRNMDTISTALTAAETGHLVIATLHTSSVVNTMERIVGVFPPEQQAQAITQLANSLQGVLTQQLVPSIDHKRRYLAYEFLSVDGASRNVMRDAEWHKLYTQIEIGSKQGMCTMDHSLAQLYEQGKISYDTLLSNSIYPDTLRQRYNRSGI